jgi:hypothetical protein
VNLAPDTVSAAFARLAAPRAAASSE